VPRIIHPGITILHSYTPSSAVPDTSVTLPQNQLSDRDALLTSMVRK